jgi:exodeoxyribonuclease VII large subunit
METELPLVAPGLVVWTVSQLTAHIKQTLETAFPNVCVVGEISEITRPVSGHLYLTLKDEGAVLRAIIWRGLAEGLRFDLKEGLQVVARGGIDVYAPRGAYQLIIRDIQPVGVGALQLAFKQLVEKLEKEGLFRAEHKAPLPRFPRRIGIVTSPTGAAIRDMINVITRRWPLAEIYLLPRRVQGDGAAEEIAAGIHLLNQKRPDLDVIIVGRGGGSLEDLWAFNEEVLARAIYASDIPVISAVGHETDYCISDFVADLRAATPTEAGEKAVPERLEILRSLGHLKSRMASSLGAAVEGARQRLRAVGQRYVLRHPEVPLRERAQRLDDFFERMRACISHMLELLREKGRAAANSLEALSPLKVLERGYSITMDGQGQVIKDPEQVNVGDGIKVMVHMGEMDARVEARRRKARTDRGS